MTFLLLLLLLLLDTVAAGVAAVCVLLRLDAVADAVAAAAGWCVAEAAAAAGAAAVSVLLCLDVVADAAAGAADLVPAKVKLYIFYGMPKKTKLKTIFAPLCGQSPEQVMAPAVADSHKLGYDKLYRLLLDHVSISTAPLHFTLASLCRGTAPFMCY